VRTALLTAVGDDVYGEKILRDSAAAGIDVSHVLLKPGVVPPAILQCSTSAGI
jgi:sugar/nucleoside kinase (ribokinase family)